MINANLRLGVTGTGTSTTWREELARAVRDPAELVRMLDLDPAMIPSAASASRHFRLLVPRGFVRRMRRGDPADPLLRQVLPDTSEGLPQPAGYVNDPLEEKAASRSPGLLVKYRGRALLVTTGACAVHCRYCFRRHFPYPSENPRRREWDASLAAIRADSTLQEIILSGGDPLMLDDATLDRLSSGLAEIPHLRSLRIHSRLPIVLPERIDNGFMCWLESARVPVTMIVHANHPREISEEVKLACNRMRGSVRYLLNQSVLLAGVNDDEDTLVALSESLFDAGVLPYYLHLPDPVAGTAHFAVSVDGGRALVARMRNRLPGYLVPRLVREEPGLPAKAVLA